MGYGCLLDQIGGSVTRNPYAAQRNTELRGSDFTGLHSAKRGRKKESGYFIATFFFLTLFSFFFSFFRFCLTLVIMHIYDVLYFVHIEITMKQATFTEVRNHAKQYFDIVESGETVRVLRNGKPIADIVPVVPDLPSWKRRKAQPLVLDGVSVSRMILEEREAGL